MRLFLALVLLSASALAGDSTIYGKLKVVSTAKSSIPCPSMNDAQMLAVASPENGSCVFNTDKKAQYVYSTIDAKWKTNGGGGGGSAGENLLLSPSFEDGLTAWTLTLGTKAEESTQVIHLEKSAKVTLSSQALDFYQSSTLKASQFSGSEVQGLVYGRFKTTIPGIKVCPRRAGAIVTSLCVDIPASGKWEYREIPFILGATSNGISINSNSVAVTGDVYIDDTFVGAQAVRVSGVALDRQSSIISNTTTIGAVNVSGALSSTEGVSDIYSYSSGTGVYTVLKKAKFDLTVRLSNTGAASAAAQINISGANIMFDSGRDQTGYHTIANWSGVIDAGGTFSFANASTNTSNSNYASVVATYSSSSSTYTSTNADTDWAACNFSTLAWQGLGTVTNNLECKRKGSDLKIRGAFTTGATLTGSTVQIPLPLWAGSQLSVKSISIKGVAGTALRNTATNNNKEFSFLYTSGAPFMTTNYIFDTSGNPYADGTGTGAFVASEIIPISGELTIPIAGWEQSNLIVGSFAEIPTTKGSSGVDFQKVYFGGGLNCNSTACSSGTCSVCKQTGGKITSVTYESAGTYRLNGIDGTKYTCSGTGNTPGSGLSICIHSPTGTSSYSVIICGYAATGATNITGADIKCDGIP